MAIPLKLLPVLFIIAGIGGLLMPETEMSPVMCIVLIIIGVVWLGVSLAAKNNNRSAGTPQNRPSDINTQQTVRSKFCPNCGAYRKEDSIFCENCGQKL